MVGLIGCLETAVRNYHFSLRNVPEESTSQLCSGGSLKSLPLVTLRATGFNIHKYHVLPTQCFVWISEQTATFTDRDLRFSGLLRSD
jgi:hypothetical protein